MADRKCPHCGEACERCREAEDQGTAIWECQDPNCGWWTEDEDEDEDDG